MCYITVILLSGKLQLTVIHDCYLVWWVCIYTCNDLCKM